MAAKDGAPPTRRNCIKMQGRAGGAATFAAMRYGFGWFVCFLGFVWLALGPTCGGSAAYVQEGNGFGVVVMLPV